MEIEKACALAFGLLRTGKRKRAKRQYWIHASFRERNVKEVLKHLPQRESTLYCISRMNRSVSKRLYHVLARARNVAITGLLVVSLNRKHYVVNKANNIQGACLYPAVKKQPLQLHFMCISPRLQQVSQTTDTRDTVNHRQPKCRNSCLCGKQTCATSV